MKQACCIHYGATGLLFCFGEIDLLQFLRRNPAPPPETLRWELAAHFQRLPCVRGAGSRKADLEVDRLTTCGLGLPAWRGRFPLRVSFERAKETKTRLGRSPLRTSLGVRGWNCVNPMAGPGPGGVTWMAWQVYRKHFLLCETVPLLPGPHPGEAAFSPLETGPPIAGNSGSPG